MFRKRYYLFALVFALFVPLAAAQTLPTPQKPEVTTAQIDAALGNDWYGLYVQDKKTGYANTAFEKVSENGQMFYRARSVTHVKLLALEQKGEITTEQTFDFDAQPPFNLIRGEYLANDGNSKQRIQLVAEAKGYEAIITVGNVTEKMTLDNLHYTLADMIAPIVWLKNGPNVGDTLITREFHPEDLTTAQVTNKVLGIKEIVHDGAAIKVYEVESVDHKTKTTTLGCYDQQGRLVTNNIASFFDMRRESEAQAKAIEFSGDLIFLFMAKLDQPVGELKTVKGLVLQGKGKEVGLLPSGPMQTVTPLGNDEYTVKIGKHHGQKFQATEQEIAAGLEETAVFPLKDAKVIALAQQAIGDAQTDQEKVKRLVKFVHEYIEYNVTYLPKVHDIIERKKGDCKSYAMLLTCLSRAVGLPAREVGGYFYMGDEIKGFGGHAWTEIVIDGSWVPVDATLGLTELPPFYISLGPTRDATDLMSQTFGKLSFQLVEVERGN